MLRYTSEDLHTDGKPTRLHWCVCLTHHVLIFSTQHFVKLKQILTQRPVTSKPRLCNASETIHTEACHVKAKSAQLKHSHTQRPVTSKPRLCNSSKATQRGQSQQFQDSATQAKRHRDLSRKSQDFRTQDLSHQSHDCATQAQPHTTHRLVTSNPNPNYTPLCSTTTYYEQPHPPPP